MAIFGYTIVPSQDSGLPSPTTNSHEHPKSSVAFGRARARWALIALGTFFFFLLFGIWGNAASEEEESSTLRAAAQRVGKYTDKLLPATWGTSKSAAIVNANYTPVSTENQWAKGSGRVGLTYNTPFNPDDLTMTEDECDAFFPDLYKEIDRSQTYFTEKQKFDKEYLEYSCDDGIWTHARVVVYNNRVYLKYYQQSDFSRSQAALALLHLAVSTSKERLPNVEFCMGMMDWGSRGKFSLDRSPDLEDVWLMPDYGWWSWPEHVGSYQEIRERTAKVENEVGWEGKVNKLFWRGSMRVGTADREALMGSAKGYDWSDVLGIDWSSPESHPVAMEDHCKWKFHGFPEGNTYSGRLRYLQNCRVVIVTHQPRYLQHWTHLYNADWSSPDQNIVYVPPAIGEPTEDKGILVHDGDGREIGRDRTWERLPETMDRLLKNDKLAKKIADNQWAFFRERYITPASAICYWRKALVGFSKVQLYDVDLSGTETSYESFMLKGMKDGARSH
ncbi:hypothetical protein CBS101457_000806 [Exobasidium rhododendri]|nr:hypothetical protein CBS101457_000806 [Exobasidium rhododendri]